MVKRDTVLIIEDDATLLRGLRDNFESRGYRVRTADDGARGLAAALGEPPDLLILDIMLPEVNGYEICRAVRERELDTTIIMVTAQGQERDIVRGLNLGADDYVTKPFSVAELLARAHAFLRRKKSGQAEEYAFGGCRLDLRSHRLTKDDVEVTLTPKEFKLLAYLVRHAGRALTRDDIMDSVWSGVLVTGRSVDRCITTLRAKVEPDPSRPTYIQTIRDIGYRFEPGDMAPIRPIGDGGASETALPLTAGSFVGRYRLVESIGRGGMAEVWRATDPRLARDVAVKLLAEHLMGQDDVLQRFDRETRAVAALSHPNVIAIFDVGAIDGRAFAVTELCEGETLRKRIERGALDFDDVKRIALGVAEGLAAAHAKGIVHRDIKPENVFLLSDGGVKVLDFGLVRRERPSDTGHADPRGTGTSSIETSLGTILGTPDYMSPEQVRGRPVDARSDLFSLGAVAWEMVSGRRAFSRETPADTLAAILTEDPGPPRPPRSHGRLPRDLKDTIGTCLAKDPEQRPASAAEFVQRLRGAHP